MTDRTRIAYKDSAKAIEVDHPDMVVSNMRKELRNGRVLIDWSQNSPAKTTVAVYSLRARPEPTVSTPVTWAEIDACATSGDPSKLSFKAADVLRRVQQLGDLMATLGAPPVERARAAAPSRARLGGGVTKVPARPLRSPPNICFVAGLDTSRLPYPLVRQPALLT